MYAYLHILKWMFKQEFGEKSLSLYHRDICTNDLITDKNNACVFYLVCI